MTFDISSITGVTADSRKVVKGNMFVALSGSKNDGYIYISDAIQNGATCIVYKKGLDHPNIPLDVAVIEVDNPHKYLADVAAHFYKYQPEHIVAVTGTNGKTSTVNFVRMIWAALGEKSASLGTLGLIGDGLDGYAGMTTPDPVHLFMTLADITQKGFTHLAMEASSHGLHQHRLDSVRVEAAGFTNLTRDHLDYHKTLEAYLDAKMRLFSDVLVDGGVAVLNADIPEFSRFSEVAALRGIRVISYGCSEHADIRIVLRRAVTSGQELQLNIFGQPYHVHLNLVGLFQAMNVMCAVGLVLSNPVVQIDDVVSILPKLEGVVGRLQSVPHNRKDIGAYVDYAHTPDGLETILNALRPHTTGRLVCVFGCGGDRDRGKRPLMGEIALRLADITIVTDDNPRTEDAAFIRSEIMAGCAGAIEVAGRRDAIRYAVQQLREGDVLVVAGKGHEQGQIFATHTEPFDDFTETQTALNQF